MDGNEIAGKVGDADENAKAEQFYPKRWTLLCEGTYTLSGVLVYLHMTTLVLSVRPAVQFRIGTVAGVFVCVVVVVVVKQVEEKKKRTTRLAYEKANTQLTREMTYRDKACIELSS